MKLKLLSLFIAAVIVCFLIAAFSFYRIFRSSTARGTTATVANRVMWAGFELPASAADVTYYVDFGGCEAEFAISEADFLSWCSDRGWTVTKIDTPVPYFKPILLPDDDHLVQHGYTFSLPDGDGVYDASTSRAAFHVSTFP